MRQIIALIFIFFVAAGMLGGVHLAFALDPEKDSQEIREIAEKAGSGEYVYVYVTDKVTNKMIEVFRDNLTRQKPEAYEENETKGDSRYALLGIGGMTLDPQPGPPKPAPSETPKEQGISPPAEPLTPQPQPQGIGIVPPPPVVAPAEIPGRGQIKEETGSPKPVTSKETRKKRKEKGKTSAERAKTTKQARPTSQKTVKKPPATRTAKEKAPAKHPTPMDVTQSLKSRGAINPAPKPEIQRRTIPPSR
jgi:hypothetical protein